MSEQVFFVTPDQINAWRDQNQVVIVDVREPNEWREAHIPGAIPMPLSTFDPSKIPDAALTASARAIYNYQYTSSSLNRQGGQYFMRLNYRF